MDAVGRIGRYISQGMCTVTGNFHPFGGAVDIIVVQQEDGSFKSSPWYVRFGKFQGVLSKENIITVSVNDVEAGFNMLLNNKGEAFFLGESKVGEGSFKLSHPALGAEIEGPTENGVCEKTDSFNVEDEQREKVTKVSDGNGKILTPTNSKESRIFSFVFGRKSDNNTNKNSTTDTCVPDEECPRRGITSKHYSESTDKQTYITTNSDRENSTYNISELTITNENPILVPQNFDLSIDETGVGESHMKYDPTENNVDEGQPDENDCHDIGSVESYNDATQSNTESCMGSTASLSTCGNGQEEITSLNTCEIIEKQTSMFSIPDEISESLDLLSCGIEHSNDGSPCNKSSMISDVTSLSESVASLCDEISNDCHEQKLETLGSDDLFVSGKSQYPSPRSGSLRSTDVSILNSESNPSSNFEQISSDLPCSLIKDDNRFISKLETVEFNKLGVREDSKIPYFPVSVSGVNSNAAAESHSISEIPNSCNSINAPQKLETVEFEIDVKKSYSLDGSNDVPDSSIISKPTEAAEYISEEVQFPFDDINNGGVEEVKIELANNDKVGEAYQLMDTTGRNVWKHTLQINKGEQSPNRISDDMKFNSAQINIHGSKICSGETGLSSRSLPTIHSHIKNFEGHNLRHSLGCSLKSVEEMRELVAFKREGSCSSKLEEKTQTEDLKVHISDISDIAISAHNDEDQQGLLISVNSGSFASTFELEEKPQAEATEIQTSGYIDISSSNNEDPQGPMTSTDTGKFTSAAKLEETPELEAAEKIHTSDSTDFSTNNDEDQQCPTTSKKNGASADAVQKVFDVEKEKISEAPNVVPVDEGVKNNGASTSIAPSQGSWNLWPFSTRSRTVSSCQPTCEEKKNMHVELTSKSSSNLNPEDAMQKANKPMMVQSLTPTSEELASLNLKEGQNVVKFSFSTPMLGIQQVDARIYLWKWNSRIIISDVDGTITKSDVLGQFMPLVGIDWSQTGVAPLFSAIKENGYQLLFLSARAISQAQLTRQFLFNLKQDGKALPDGPVIISPDGLFPSLYREVIRRAPHEFKISCLEVIKELFPPDCSPFYAGFGNRETDEISYLKVGIPIGKIFIINPQGRIVVNRQVDTTSYASLHDLVNGIFPPISSLEQD